ncbi:MAG: hypothetical protein R3C25_11855 [Hyphomonadaceae bacterium]
MRKAWAAVLLGGLAAGTLDILYAFLVYGPLSYGVTPLQVLQSVAAGWMGREAARAGGVESAALGLATHFMIATIMAGVFVALAARIRTLTRRALLCGFLYGLVLYAVMNYVVVPLSSAGAGGHFPTDWGDAVERLQRSFSRVKTDDAYPWMIWGTIFTHTVLVAMPVALIAKHFQRD